MPYSFIHLSLLLPLSIVISLCVCEFQSVLHYAENTLCLSVHTECIFKLFPDLFMSFCYSKPCSKGCTYPKMEITETWNMCIFNVIREYIITFQNGCNNLQSPKQYVKVPISIPNTCDWQKFYWLKTWRLKNHHCCFNL